MSVSQSLRGADRSQSSLAAVVAQLSLVRSRWQRFESIMLWAIGVCGMFVFVVEGYGQRQRGASREGRRQVLVVGASESCAQQGRYR